MENLLSMWLHDQKSVPRSPEFHSDPKRNQSLIWQHLKIICGKELMFRLHYIYTPKL